MKTRRSVFLGTLPLNPAHVATQLLDVYQTTGVAADYLNSLAAGVAVGVDSAGYAVPATNIATFIGVIEAPAMEGMGVNLHSLANKQVTYIKGATEFETNNFVTGVAYAPGDPLGVGANGALQKAGTAAERIGVIMSGRSAAAVDNEVPLICVLD
jgi:hypothetical protein